MYFTLFITIALLSWGVSALLDHRFKKYSKVNISLTGRQVAEKMLRDNGITDVQVTCTPGHLTDHYDPRTKTVNLSEAVYDSANVAAAAVARTIDRSIEEVTVGEGEIVKQLRRSSAADFGLRGELSYIDAVIAAVNDEQNLVEKEHKIDLIRWEHAGELIPFDYFNINAILSYLVKVNIVARWVLLDVKRGREMLSRIMTELDGKELINKQ